MFLSAMKKGLTQFVSNLCFSYGGPDESRTRVQTIFNFYFYKVILFSLVRTIACNKQDTIAYPLNFRRKAKAFLFPNPQYLKYFKTP